ncbi:MAG: Rpn family recombination-promoting nuclease/putative transposase [Bacteroidales bacterium]|nr:Rpn family recombination-promoting nuclease/putative transposase [Bacteroidales bacterium]
MDKTLYLDPKNDLIFKKIFGEHDDLLISFLNAIMPLSPGQQIETIQYLTPEQVPDRPFGKNTIVDVRCIDNFKRQFIVEMQMFWSEIFNNRLVFNTTKAYIRQIERGDDFNLLQTVYGLGILNDVFDKRTDEFYHHYQSINRYDTEDVIEGLEFVLVELPKFKPEKWKERKLSALWLRFLREINEKNQQSGSGITIRSSHTKSNHNMRSRGIYRIRTQSLRNLLE